MHQSHRAAPDLDCPQKHSFKILGVELDSTQRAEMLCIRMTRVQLVRDRQPACSTICLPTVCQPARHMVSRTWSSVSPMGMEKPTRSVVPEAGRKKNFHSRVTRPSTCIVSSFESQLLVLHIDHAFSHTRC